MPSALDALRAALDAAVADALQPRLDAIARLRGALDTYEAAMRAEAEAIVAARAAATVGVELPLLDGSAGASRSVVECALELVALLDPAEPYAADPGADTRTERPVAVDPAAIDEPPASPEAPRQDAATPVSTDALHAWARAPRSAPEPVSPRQQILQQRQVLQSLLDRVGEPPSGTSDVDLIDELDRLDEISSPENLERWARLGRDAQRAWIAYLVARGRALRDRASLVPSLRGRVRGVLVRFPTFASTARPGFINGMSPDHGPLSASWEADARELLVELRLHAGVRVSDPVPSQPGGGAARRDRRAEERDDEEGERPPRVDAELRSRVQGMRALLFGGTPREDARAKLEASFGFASLEWPESDKPRRVEALANAIARGAFDLVLINRLVHHKDSDKVVHAARDAGTPWAMIDTGYGVAAVRQALEVALDGAARHVPTH